MTKTLLLATTAMMLASTSAFADEPQVAQAPVPTGPEAQAPLSDAAQRGVLVFTPDFFAAQRPNTAQDMVNRVPGFSLNDGSGSRGFEGAVGNALINNARPASKSDTVSNVLGRTPADQVERIELIRGGAPGIDMQGYAVIVNVILKTQDSRQSILTWNGVFFDGGQDVFGGSYQYTRTQGDRTWSVSLSDGIGTSDSNGEGRVIRRNAAGDIIRDETHYNDGYGGGGNIRGAYAGPFAGGKIDVTGRLGVNDWNSLQTQTSPTVLRDYTYGEDATNGELGVVYTRPLNARWNLETRLIHSFEDFDSRSVNNITDSGIADPEQVFSADGKSSETILRGLLRHERSANLTIEGGGEIAYNMLEVDQDYSVGGINVPLPSASVKVEEVRGEAFSKATWRVSPRLTVEGGLRVEASTITQSGDADQEKSFVFAKPRLLATWTPVANNQLQFRFERELGQLDFGDFAASADLEDENVFGGNVDLEPEQRWITELIYEGRFWGDGALKIGLRHDEIIDVIDQLPLENDLSATGNIGDGTLDQLSVTLTVPTQKLGISGGRFSFRNDWNKTEVTDPTTGRSRPISGIRPTQANFGFEQDIVSWKLQWGANWIPRLGQASYYPDEVNGWTGKDYYEVFAEYKPTPTLAIRAQLNIWDTFDVQRTAYADRTPERPIAFVENRYIDPRTFFQVRLRKTF